VCALGVPDEVQRMGGGRLRARAEPDRYPGALAVTLGSKLSADRRGRHVDPSPQSGPRELPFGVGSGP
jgi:hypothetical protein